MLHTNEFGPEYSPDEYAKLQVELERSGGAILPDACLGDSLVFKAKKGGKKTVTQTCHCGNQSMAVVTYDPAVPDSMMSDLKERGGGFARICLVCDAVGQWPKFMHVMDPPETEADEDE